MDKAKKNRPARQDSGRITGKRTKTKDDGVKSDEQDDAEVEEFYEILRRIKVVVKYFEKGGGESKPEPAAAAGGSRLWSPRFELEDFKEAGKDEEESDGVAERNFVAGNLDLNADPEADQDSD